MLILTDVEAVYAHGGKCSEVNDTPALRIGYVVKMYPRFSETFILSEVLELERQGAQPEIFSLMKPDDGRFHADLARVRAKVTYAPEVPLVAWCAISAAHRQVFDWDRRRYCRVLLDVLTGPRAHHAAALKCFLQAGYLAPCVRNRRIRHVHAHFACSATSVAYYLHGLAGVSYSFTAHAKDIYTDTVNPDELRRKLLAARFVVTVSDYNREYLARIDGAQRIIRIYNGLDLERFSPNGASRATPPLILAVGRLVEKKGFADLIRACVRLKRNGISFRCQIVGKGPLEHELRALITELGLQEHVWLPGPLPREALLELYPRASVAVAPCVIGSDGNRDGLPTVLTEAIALGVPVVATDVTGVPELVEDGRTGLLVPQRNPEALARAIERILDNPGGAQALAQAGRERVARDFNLRINVAQLRELFEQVATR